MNNKIENKIYAYDDLFNLLIKLDLNNKIPNKFIISGKKGIGKSTFAYHFINYLFSKNEEYKYDTKKFEINDKNRSSKLVNNLSHPNFFLIDVDDDKEYISIDKIRKSFDFINKSSMDNNYRIILINNAEHLNLNSSNALLKIIEEPNEKLIFIIIHNSNYKLLDTIRSRCVIFKKTLSASESAFIFEKITNTKFLDIYNDNYLAEFMTVEELIFLKDFCEKYKYEGKIHTKGVLNFYFNMNKNKHDKKYYFILLKLIQIYLYDKNFNFFSEKNYLWYSSFFKKISDAKRYNLNIENLFFKFQTENLNG